MKKLLMRAAVAACCCIAVSAVAADVPPMPVKAPQVAASWTGFYLGLDAGVQSTRTDLTTTSITSVGILGPLTLSPEGANSLPYDATGFRFGAFGGINRQVSPQWVLGIEADVGWADNETTLGGVAVPGLFCCASAGHGSSVRTTWDASVRSRIGYLVTPTFLLYATGGVAWQHFEEHVRCGFPVCGTDVTGVTLTPYSLTSAFTKTGWTVGGGGEAMLSPNWFLRASYRYSDFGTVTFTNTSVATGGEVGPTTITATLDLRLRTHTAALGLAYRFGGTDARAYAAGPVAPIYQASVAPVSWAGFHLGLGTGLRATRTDVATTSAFVAGAPVDFTNFATSEPLDKTSFRFSVYGGYNWQVAPQWVVGLEGDWGWANRTASLPGFPFTPGFITSGIATDLLSVKTTWDASARGRIGYLVTPTVLAYLTGGAAWLHYEVVSSCPGFCALPVFSLSPVVITSAATKAGWTIGGGVESLWWGRWFARAEYRYADFGSESFTLARAGAGELVGSVVDNFDVKIRTHTAAFGLAYKFAD